MHAVNTIHPPLQVDQSVYTVLPPQLSVRPSMVLVFEVWMLRGAVSPTDRAVGWGAFPICDHQFRTIEGRYVNCIILYEDVCVWVIKYTR